MTLYLLYRLGRFIHRIRATRPRPATVLPAGPAPFCAVCGGQGCAWCPGPGWR